MYLMYVDECGDNGMSFPGSSRYFILSGMVMHESLWTYNMETISNSLSSLYSKYGFDRELEIHAKNMLGRTGKDYSNISKVNRLLMLRELLKFESTLNGSIRVINVVVDKDGKGGAFNPFERAWDALINRFENTIRHGNFPIIAANTQPAYPEHGMLIVDQTDENKLRFLIRRMRHNNLVPSAYGDGEYRSDLLWVIEDPLHKQSQHSLPIQLCDTNAYFLRQLIEPNSTIRKHDAQNYFYFLRPILLREANPKDELGRVWL